jgi:hypothetical protein
MVQARTKVTRFARDDSSVCKYEMFDAENVRF